MATIDVSDELAASFSGELLAPDSAGYDAARLVHARAEQVTARVLNLYASVWEAQSGPTPFALSGEAPAGFSHGGGESDTPVDAILLDVQLPDGSGLTLLDDLPQLVRERRPVIVAVTGGVMPEQRAAAVAAGCDAIVTKPYVAADLTQTLAAHLATR